MSIQQVENFRISDGRCFASQAEAEHEECIGLANTIPTKERMVKDAWSLKSLRATIADVRKWLANAEESLAQMAGGGKNRQE